jgi:hypothetical protein
MKAVLHEHEELSLKRGSGLDKSGRGEKGP